MRNPFHFRNRSKVSVIIVTHSNKAWLARSLPTLLAQSYSDVEVIVVDNASVDGGGEFVQQHFPSVRVVFERENRGFGAGCNAGVAISNGNYFIFGNEDMEFERDYVKRLVEVMDNEQSVGACQGTTYEFRIQKSPKSFATGQAEVRSKKIVQSWGLYFNYTGMLTGETKQARNEENNKEIFAATAPLCVRKTIYDMVGGFDEIFFLYFEEVDLCWRIWLSGKRVIYVPNAGVFHLGGGSTRKLPPEEILTYTVRNRLASYFINLGAGRLVIAIGLQLLIGGCAMLAFMVQGKLALLLAVVRADVWNISMFLRLLKRRIRVQSNRVMGDEELLKRVSGRFPVSKLLTFVGIHR